MLENFVGTWRLLHCKLFNTSGIELVDPLHSASGLLMYTNEGLMSVQIMGPDHENSIKGNMLEASPELFEQSFKNYIAYYGPYNINEKEKIVTHTVLGSLWPNIINKTLLRRFEFKNENTLVLSNVEPETFVTIEPVTRYLTWSRIDS